MTTYQHPRTTWQAYTATLPYARDLYMQWQATMFDPDYEQALNDYILAMDQGTSDSRRQELLQQSRKNLAALKNSGDEHITTDLALIRVLSALGQTDQAAYIADLLLKNLAQNDNIPLDRPFLPPSGDFDHRPVQDTLAGWLRSALENAREPSQSISDTQEQQPPSVPAEPETPSQPKPQTQKIGRNAKCPCGSGKKYKKCCEALDTQALTQDQSHHPEPQSPVASDFTAPQASPQEPTATWSINIKGGIKVVAPADISNMNTYVLLEQEDWYEPEIEFVRALIQTGMTAMDCDTGYGVYALSIAAKMQGHGKVIALNPDPLFFESLQENRLQEIITTEPDHTALDFIRLGSSDQDMQQLCQGSPLVMFPASNELIKTFKDLNLDIYKLIPGLNALAPYQESNSALQGNLFACSKERAQILRQNNLLAASPNTTRSSSPDINGLMDNIQNDHHERPAYHPDKLELFEEDDKDLIKAYKTVVYDQQEELDLKASEAFNNLIRGYVKQARTIFNKILEKTVQNHEAQKLWLQAFNELASLRNKRPKKQKNDNIPALEQSGYKILNPAGMGWSGSGALTAYFKEFPNITFVDAGEISHIEGTISLMNLRSFQGSHGEFFKFLVLFFGFTLFGYSSSKSFKQRYGLERSKVKSRHMLDFISYAEGALHFMRLMKHIHDGNKIKYKVFKQAANLLINKICESYADEHTEYVLMDNSLHISTIHNIEYIDNMQVLCTYRDPRSNYVARVKEDWKFGPRIYKNGPVAYAESYRHFREYTGNIIENLKNNRDNVWTVQFEDFVSSEDYRQDLARKLKLDPARQDRHTHFKPWESIKNIDNYKRYENQEEILQIQQKLPQYLWEQQSNTT